MKYYTMHDRKAMKAAQEKLTSLDRAILEKCEIGMNIIRCIKAGKPFINKGGSKEFATTDEVLRSVERLQKLELLEKR